MTEEFAPIVTEAGVAAPDFTTIHTLLQTRFRDIYGADIYIDPDSQDGQLIGLFALAISDLNAACVALYNAFSPATAQGSGLSSVVKINGLRRKSPGRSEAVVKVVGVAGTVIHDGLISDGTYRWALPSKQVIPAEGFVLAQAVCQVDGAVTASAHTINQIVTPVRGWQSVENPEAAIPGVALESDAELRIRQSRSVAAPSQSIFEGIYANVWQIQGVTRLAAYENPTHEFDFRGLPPHSICLVVEGGDANEIGQAMLLRKNPGCNSVPYLPADPANPDPTAIQLTLKDATNDWRKINFYRPTPVNIVIKITLETFPGWSPDIASEIKRAVVTYINALPIGADLYYFRMSAPINMCNKRFVDTYAVKDVLIGTENGTMGKNDIVINFRSAAACNFTSVDIIPEVSTKPEQ